ncbi:protein of unknown function [Micropruina glycogenica]|uniref:Uncharacterized protein n=1 Tax=Micropruina glycogenica TaxID=75385 RepID=A0A2N9JJZ3_9ACTN|nr:protein of unknown function [Micropruina glycogenica]
MRLDGGGHEFVGGQPVRDLGAVDGAPVEVLDGGAQFVDAVGHPIPLEGELGVGPVQHVVLVQPGEQQLAAEAVVIAHPVAGDREAEDAVEDHAVLHEPGVVGQFELLGGGLGQGGDAAIDRHRLAKRGQVAAQFFERVQKERHALLDHERVERQVAAHVGAVVNQVPHHEGLFSELLIVEQFGGLGRQVELGHLDGSAEHPAEPSGLAVGEDRAPGEGGNLPHRDGLGEQDGRVGVVARGEVKKTNRYEQLVAVVGGLELRHEVGPDHLYEHGLNQPAARAVLGVHRKDHEVGQAVHSKLLGLEQHQRVVEVGHAEALGRPPREVGLQGVQVGGVMGEQGRQFGDGAGERGEKFAGVDVVARFVNGSIGRLQGLQFGGGRLQSQPRGVAGEGRDFNISNGRHAEILT